MEGLFFEYSGLEWYTNMLVADMYMYETQSTKPLLIWNAKVNVLCPVFNSLVLTYNARAEQEHYILTKTLSSGMQLCIQ
jgi:hypothetical protein